MAEAISLSQSLHFILRTRWNNHLSAGQLRPRKSKQLQTVPSEASVVTSSPLPLWHIFESNWKRSWTGTQWRRLPCSLRGFRGSMSRNLLQVIGTSLNSQHKGEKASTPQHKYNLKQNNWILTKNATLFGCNAKTYNHFRNRQFLGIKPRLRYDHQMLRYPRKNRTYNCTKIYVIKFIKISPKKFIKISFIQNQPKLESTQIFFNWRMDK